MRAHSHTDIERVYLAGRFGRVAELQQAAADVRAAGHEVVSSWLESTPLAPAELEPSGRAARAATSDLRDLRSATTFVAFTEASDEPQGRGGRHTELGVAIALGLRVLVVGPREHVFHCLPVIERYDAWPAALDALGQSGRSSTATG